MADFKIGNKFGIAIVEFQSEIVSRRDPAKILIHINDGTTAEIHAVIEDHQGADGGYYPIVVFKMAGDGK
jgi:hypothetical protein